MVEALKEFLPMDVAVKIYDRIYDEDIKEEEGQLGMTFGDWKSRFDDDFEAVWAADTPGFGRAGNGCCGDCDDCRIVQIDRGRHQKTLYLWDDAFVSLAEAKKPFLIRNEDGTEIKALYVDIGDAISGAKERGFKKFEIFRWGGVFANRTDKWVFAFRIGEEV